MGKKTTVLCVLDGVGENPSAHGNAVAAAHTPTLDKFYSTYPHSQLLTHGPAVGLPEGQMGNSEVGHMNLGAGRIVLQQLEHIQKDLENGNFLQKTEVQPLLKAVQTTQAVHLLGMVSDGGVHSHISHTLGLIKALAPLGKPIYIHIISDGRDTPPQAAKDQLAAFQKAVTATPNAHIASICGRFYAMDRDKRLERTTAAFELLTAAKGLEATSLESAIAQAYSREEADEFIQPTALPPLKNGGMLKKGDAIVFTNFRADRMRQITEAFIKAGYKTLFTMTQYDQNFNENVSVLYPPEGVKNTLGEVISTAGKTQLRIAETEKYAHVTFFFNGGAETPFSGEDRVIVPSPQVRTYDLAPEMSIKDLGTKLCSAILAGTYDFIVCNVANGDMVGHTGNFAAAIQAMEAVDNFLKDLEAAILENGGQLLLTADHGNCEHMLEDDGSVVTSHSIYPVPLFYVGPDALQLQDGRLCDVAATLLALMHLPQPTEMTGKSLLKGA